MTAQVTERLTYNGNEVSMRTQPLDQYFELAGIAPGFVAPSTANWRGYIGHWEISDDRLYLIGFRGWIKGYKEVGLETLFPDFSDRVFAHWYSGTISIPEGEMLEYVHMGYASMYERDRFLEFQRGILVKEWVRENRGTP